MSQAMKVRRPRSEVRADVRECVYFVSAVGTDLVKIGIARGMANRWSALRTSCPVRLVLEALVFDAYKDEEIALHERFAANRSHGEWFHVTDELRAVMAPHRQAGRTWADQYERETAELLRWRAERNLNREE